MDGHTIKVVIGKDGKVSVEVQGVKGEGCSALVDALTAGIGATESDTATGEYYEHGEYVYVG